MSETGNCYENAPVASFWRSLKAEETQGSGVETREETRRYVFAYIEGFYNTTRMHSSLNQISTREFQRQVDEKLRAEKQQKKFISARA